MRKEFPKDDRRPRAARKISLAAYAWLCCAAAAHAQAPADLKQVLQRLDRLEEQNRTLIEEVRALKEELAASRNSAPTPTAPLEDRVAVEESRVAELAQTKVEASRRFPIRITGMALFNTFLNSHTVGDLEYPTTAAPGGSQSAGAGLRQTTIGLEYSGPQTLWNGKVRGSLFMDFFGGSGRTLDQLVRLRTATIGVDWSGRSVEVGLEKPLISPRDPNSLAQVGVSPLSGAGNLWLWLPQVRVEQRLRLGGQTALRAQVAAVQTNEALPTQTAASTPPYAPGTGYPPEYETRRPGLEGRLEFSHGENRRIEIAPGFHRSVTHVAGASVPSNVFSVDWYAHALPPVEFTGAMFTGQNVANLGTGDYRQGFTIIAPHVVRPVQSRGGWAQLTLRATSRLSFNLFSGVQDDRNSDLLAGSIGRNLAYGANFFYRLAPNVLLSFESSQVRTNYVRAGGLLNNHYDLALAYLF
jgi:hypothetical protein